MNQKIYNEDCVKGMKKIKIAKIYFLTYIR